MAVKLEQLETFLRLLESDQDGEVLNAARFIVRIATAEKQNVVELLKAQLGRTNTVYVDKIVYRDRPQPNREPENPNEWARRHADPNWKRERDRNPTEEFLRRAAENLKREQEARARRGGRAFDDAEMTDEERAERRAKKEADRKSRFGDDRKILNTLVEKLKEYIEEGLHGLENWDIEWASKVPYEVEADMWLTPKQLATAKRIIAEIKRAQGWSPGS